MHMCKKSLPANNDIIKHKYQFIKVNSQQRFVCITSIYSGKKSKIQSENIQNDPFEKKFVPNFKISVLKIF